MSTDFLNRRMDLIHSTIPGHSVDDDNYDILTMDTSYPVKLAGIIIKLFKAVNPYERGHYILKNSSNDTILEIDKNKVYDFAGRTIIDNMGSGKMYENTFNVYDNGDYVMAIIDFDNKVLYLCSQTNFASFITGNDCKFRLFDITGDIEVTINDEVKAINRNKLSEAVGFDSKEDSFSFVRDSNDNVVYQCPEYTEFNETTGNPTGNAFSYVPVANVDVRNINSFNASCYPLVFPNINSNYNDFFETVDSCRNMIQVSGTVNDIFIEKYCYTADELKNLHILNYDESTKTIYPTYSPSYITSYIDSIFKSGKEDNYYYFIRDKSGYDDFTFEKTNTSDDQMIIPINKSTHKFTSLEIVNGNVNKCNDYRYELNFNNNYRLAQNLVGNWWSHGFNDDSTWAYSYDVRAGSENKPSSYKFILPYINNSDAYGVYDLSRCGRYLSSDGLIVNLDIAPNMTNVYLSHTANSSDIRHIMNSDKFKNVAKIINLYGNKDSDYINYIYKQMLSNNHDYGVMTYFDNNGKLMLDDCPVAAVAMYTENLDEIINSSWGSLNDFCRGNEHNQNLVRYKTSTNEGSGLSDNYYILYRLMYFNSNDINNPDNNLNLAMYHNDIVGPNTIKQVDAVIPQGRKNRFRYKVSQDFILNSNNHNTSIFVKKVDNTYRYYIANFFSKAVPRVIEKNTEGTTVNCDISVVKMMNCKQVFMAKKNPNNSQYLTFRQSSVDAYSVLKYIDDEQEYELFVYYAINKAGDLSYASATYEILVDAFKYSNGSLYLYYYGNDNKIYRIRLYIDMASYNDKWNNYSIDLENVFTDIDYFTVPKCVVGTHTGYNTSTGEGLELYDRAYCALKGINTYNQLSGANASSEVMYNVIKDYFLYGENILYNKDKDGIPKFASYKYPINNSYITTLTLTVNQDEHILCYRRNSSKIISDLIGEDTFVYQDGPAPELSRTKNMDTSAYIFNVSSYQDFISNVYVAKTTDNIISNITNNNGDTIQPLLNPLQLKYVNGTGIREEYYKNATIAEFFDYMSLYDLGKPMSEQKINTNSWANINLLDKGTFDNVWGTISILNKDGIYENHFIDNSGNLVTLKSSAIISIIIPNDNRYGFNEIHIYDKSKKDITQNYISNEKIYATITETGNKSVINVSLTDQNNVVLNTNGILGSLQRDTIDWNSLLIALSSNTSVDVLSDSLSNIKNKLNRFFTGNAQNINDNVSTEQSSNPSEDDATFEEKYNIYNYKIGKGYKDNALEKTNDNRGVIVLVTENGKITIDKHGSDDETRWTENISASEIYPKRMYISKEGIICTKEYYDREKNPLPDNDPSDNSDSNDEYVTVSSLNNQVKLLKSEIKSSTALGSAIVQYLIEAYLMEPKRFSYWHQKMLGNDPVWETPEPSLRDQYFIPNKVYDLEDKVTSMEDAGLPGIISAMTAKINELESTVKSLRDELNNTTHSSDTV